MTSKAEQQRAKLERLREHTTQTSTENDTHTTEHQPTKQVPTRVKPVRRTVDLPAAHHRALDTWCAETAHELGRARVTGQDVLRTLVAELLRDETTARKVRKALSEDQ